MESAPGVREAPAGGSALANPERIVRCYHCRTAIVVPRAGRTASCPICYKGIVLDDLFVRDAGFSGKLLTCGKVLVERKGRSVGRPVEAGGGIEINGTLEGTLTSGGPVLVGSRGRLKGDVHATSLVIKAGAVVDGGHFHIAPIDAGP